MPRRSSFWRNRASNCLLENLVRERVLEESASARLAHDAPVEELVERVTDRGLVPPADVAKRVVRESRTDGRGDLGGGARLLRELPDTHRHQRLETRGRSALFAMTKVVDELRQEERVPGGNR